MDPILWQKSYISCNPWEIPLNITWSTIQTWLSFEKQNWIICTMDGYFKHISESTIQTTIQNLMATQYVAPSWEMLIISSKALAKSVQIINALPWSISSQSKQNLIHWCKNQSRIKEESFWSLQSGLYGMKSLELLKRKYY